MSQCIPDQPEPAQCSVVTVAASRRVVATNGTAARQPHCYNVARRRSHAAILPCPGLLAGAASGVTRSCQDVSGVLCMLGSWRRDIEGTSSSLLSPDTPQIGPTPTIQMFDTHSRNAKFQHCQRIEKKMIFHLLAFTFLKL